MRRLVHLNGDLLAERLDVPIGFISVGWGGTSVGQWLPGAPGPDVSPLYDRLRNALEIIGPNGARAVLWHQGESDSASGTRGERYADRLQQVIDQSRKDGEFDIPWIVAKAAYLPSTSSRSESRILEGQSQVIQNDALVFAGPLTDDLIGNEWRWDTIHFNEAGLREHALRWADAIEMVIVPEPPSLILCLVAYLAVHVRLRRSHTMRP